jgi:hypothetical protein
MPSERSGTDIIGRASWSIRYRKDFFGIVFVSEFPQQTAPPKIITTQAVIRKPTIDQWIHFLYSK